MFDVNVANINNRNLTNQMMKNFKNVIDKVNPNAFYMAIVEDTDDPYKLGRVRVRIPSIHGSNKTEVYYLPNSALPWAKPAIFNGAANDMGQFIVPAKGTRIIVSFECDDINKPLYFGGFPTLVSNTKLLNDNQNIFFGQELEIKTDDRITDLNKDSSQYVLFKSLKGSTIIIDDKDGKESIKIVDAAGQQIIMENESDFALPRRGNNTNPPSTASIKVITNGRVTFDCDDFNVEAKTTNIPDYISLEGTGDKNDVYEQINPSDFWEIKHNLYKYPSVTVVDNEGTQVMGDVVYKSNTLIQISFSEALSGKAYLN